MFGDVKIKRYFVYFKDRFNLFRNDVKDRDLI